MRIVIVGSNALSCLLAARLAPTLQSDDSLCLLVRDPQIENQIIKNGFTLEDKGVSSYFRIDGHARISQNPGDHKTLAVTALRCCVSTGDFDKISECDLVFLCDGADTTAETIPKIIPFLSPTTLLISIQEGISQLKPLKKLAEERRATVALATSSSDIFQEQNRVICLDPGTFKIGLLTGGKSAADLLRLSCDLFIRTNLHIEILAEAESDAIRQLLWTQFFLAIAINPLAAIYRRPNGQLLTSCSVRGNMKKTIREAIAVAEAEGFTLNSDPIKLVFAYLRREKTRIAPMLRNINNRQPTGIEALNGTISGLGTKHSIPTPVNDDLIMRIKKLEDAYL